jgi:para-aminobenzoate synthetase component 1
MTNPSPRAAAVRVREIPFADPLAVFAALRGDGLAVLLDSAAAGPDTGRYSVVAVKPVAEAHAGWSEGFERLAQLAEALPFLRTPPDWPVAPALIGSLGYELRRALERVPSRHPPEAGPADLLYGLFDMVAVFDLSERRAAILSYDLVPGREDRAARTDGLAARIQKAPPIGAADSLPKITWPKITWNADRTRDAYAERVQRVREYILAGDVYQANFTQRWRAGRPPQLDPFLLYRSLRALSPAPYAAFIEDGRGNAILSASPERFLKLTADRRIDTRPIKGTRPRGGTPEQDRAHAEALVASAKDQAENLMVVDLLRNDLGRVAKTGTVAVPELNTLHSFASVHHLVSTVTAMLRPGLGPLDLIRATFPGGSVTGAPKIRAMEIIDELEAGRRGAYCGAIGWIGPDRAMELSISIRTLTVTADHVTAQAGGGIVADSDPLAEYEEALTKARPLLATLDPSYRAG